MQSIGIVCKTGDTHHIRQISIWTVLQHTEASIKKRKSTVLTIVNRLTGPAALMSTLILSSSPELIVVPYSPKEFNVLDTYPKNSPSEASQIFKHPVVLHKMQHQQSEMEKENLELTSDQDDQKV